MDSRTMDLIRRMVVERDWEQFHTPENLAKSIAIEAGELLECFQWNHSPESSLVEAELADVLTYCLLLADALDVDVDQIVQDKVSVTRAKYPVKGHEFLPVGGQDFGPLVAIRTAPGWPAGLPAWAGVVLATAGS